MRYYAHSLEGKSPDEWQDLREHLINVGELAGRFAEPFGGKEWARLAGRWHDMGKYSNEFQKMLYDANGIETHLETKPGKPIHSQAGGHLAQQRLKGGLERIFCWLIMGHHTGLADYMTDYTGAKALEPKMVNPESSRAIINMVPDEIKNQPSPGVPKLLSQKADVSFFTRMLFSSLVDADFLDTEAFMNQEQSQLRNVQYPPLSKLLQAFDRYMDHLCQKAKRTALNSTRADILKQCREAANEPPGVFTLTVPTGGGKTLASMAYALRHAVRHKRHRIIYVIPYTSIIEQTAQVFREIPGFEHAVLEHHSNLSTEDESKESVRSRLAAENWDAPIIVTTAVQFFESLYASKTSRCRKLHNIASSVAIFDEAQCLPPKYLRPIVYAIRELERHYDVTPVLCTATQPVLTQTERFDFKFKEGFSDSREIIEDPDSLAHNLKRVNIQTLADLEPVTHEQVRSSMLEENASVLCIVNRKDDARELAQLLPTSQTIYLTTNLYPAHRLQMLKEIKNRVVNDSANLFVISTSLVEAGVDIDFPVVYRALAGLDSIAQAAGRCNREGSLPQLGKTVVFNPEKQPDYVQSSASLAREYLNSDNLEHILSNDNYRSYFEQRFFQLGEQALDEKGILRLLDGNLDFSFRTAAQRFRLIDDEWQLPLIIPEGEAAKLVESLKYTQSRKTLRKLQRFTISIPRQVMWQLVDGHHAREIAELPGTYFLDDLGLYDKRLGFIPPDKIDAYDPTITIQ